MFSPNLWSFDAPNTHITYKYNEGEANKKCEKQICKRIHSHPFNKVVNLDSNNFYFCIFSSNLFLVILKKRQQTVHRTQLNKKISLSLKNENTYEFKIDLWLYFAMIVFRIFCCFSIYDIVIRLASN